MLRASANNGVVDGVTTMRDGIDHDHLAIGTGTVILWKLSKRPLRFAHLGKNTTFEDDLGVRWHAHLVGFAFDHFDRTSQQRGGDLHFVLIERKNRP